MGQIDISQTAEGFSSSAMGTRRGLDIDQGHGIYIVGNRLVVTKEKGQTGLRWDMTVGSVFGSFSTQMVPFFEDTPKPLDQVESTVKKLDVDLAEVTLVEIKKPSFFSKGHVTINLRSGSKFTLLLLNSEEEFGKELFEAVRELLQKHLPEALKIA